MRKRTIDRPASAHLVRGSLYGIVAVAANGFGGFAFWAFVARAEIPATVGSAQRLFTAVLVATYVTSLGLPVTVARHCTDRTSRSSAFFLRSSTATIASSAAAAVVLATFGGDRLLSPLGVSGWFATAGLLAFLISGMSLAVLVETRLIALRQWGWVVGRVLVVVVLRFPLLMVGPADRAVWAFVLVAALPAASGLVGAIVLHSIGPSATPLAADDRALWRRVSSVNYVGLLGSQGPQFLVPLVVALAVADADFAPFYLAWGATAFVFVIPHMIGQTLLAEASRPEAAMAVLVRRSLEVSLVTVVLVVIGSLVAEPVVGLLLGEEYREAGRVLPWLVGASIPWSFTCTALAVARARGDSTLIVGLTSGYAVVSIAGAGLGVIANGVAGASVGWFLANLVVGAGAAWILRSSLSGIARDVSFDVAVVGSREPSTSGGVA